MFLRRLRIQPTPTPSLNLLLRWSTMGSRVDSFSVPYAAAEIEAASIEDLKTTINQVARSRGFSCVPVSWEDAQRGTVNGALSCWGSNISDVRLWAKSGELLYTLRSNNWNERLGYVAAKDVSVAIGNYTHSPAKVISLKSFLQGIGEHGSAVGIKSHNLYKGTVDELLSVRFQTVFLPIRSGAAKGKLEFCTEVYNYNTTSDAEPRNLLLLATPQGTSIQQDGKSAERVYFHKADGRGLVHRYWLEAEQSTHKVGGAQQESCDEEADALQRGKATAIRIGTRAMGTRFNVQMLIQLPLKQKPSRRSSGDFEPCVGYGYCPRGGFGLIARGARGVSVRGAGRDPMRGIGARGIWVGRGGGGGRGGGARGFASSPPRVGVCNSARVSCGEETGIYSGVAKPIIVRDASQHGTITVTMYYTVAGGVPSAKDVCAAVDDLDELYRACRTDKNLHDCDEITAELTVAKMK